MKIHILALDFGGTKLSAALFEHAVSAGYSLAEVAAVAITDLRLLDQRRVFTPAEAGAEDELAAMLAMARDLSAGRAPAAVGVSFGGPVDFARGVVRLSHHVRGWEEMPLRAVLEREFGCPAAVDNDANVAALGEHRFGAGRGVDDLMYVTISTGVGGGWVLGGRPWRGHEGMAGEIGHMVVDPAGPLCLCGKRGCVERLASGPYMAADYVARKSPLPNPLPKGEGTPAPLPQDEGTLVPLPEGGVRGEPGLTGRDVAAAAAAGDDTAREILLRGAWAVGVGLGNAANLINPQRFILGGGVTKSGEVWWAEVRRAAAATALPEVRFDIVRAALGDDAPLWGAVALALLA